VGDDVRLSDIDELRLQRLRQAGRGRAAGFRAQNVIQNVIQAIGEKT